MIALATAAWADPFEIRPVAMLEVDAFWQPEEDIAVTGFDVRRLYLGAVVKPIRPVDLRATVDFAGEHPRILDANVGWAPAEWVSVEVGHAKTPLFPSARDLSIETTALPELPLVVEAFWPGRDTGLEGHLASYRLPVEARLRVGNGSTSPTGNDNPQLALDARADVVGGRERPGSDRSELVGVRVGGGYHRQDAEDREGIAGRTITGFLFWRPPTVSGPRWVAEGHAVLDLGPVRGTLEGAVADESRSIDTDGNPDTPRDPLPSVRSRGYSIEAAWMTTGQHRGPSMWPVDESDPLGIEVVGRLESLWTGEGARDVQAGGAFGGEVGARLWWPFGVGIGATAEVLELDTPPLEVPEVTQVRTLLLRTTVRLK